MIRLTSHWWWFMIGTAILRIADAFDGECPGGWINYDKSCYSFMGQRTSSWREALNICNASIQSVHLVSLNSVHEARFLAKWLEENDFKRKGWWTSGYSINDRWEWAGDGSKFTFYTPGARLDTNPSSRIGYIWNDDSYVWTATNERTQLSIICELPKSKLHSYYSDMPGINYGLEGIDYVLHKRGPKIILEPRDTITYANGPRHSVELPCKADSYPSAVYKWKKFSTGLEITPSNSTYVINDGTLIIRNVSIKDFGLYFCNVSNGAANTRTRIASFSNSYVKEFPKTRLDVYGTEGSGKSIPCEAPSHFPQSLSFAWMYDTVKNFLHESTRIFLSSDGTLHFSYLTRGDQRTYACSVVIPELHTGYYGPFFALKIDPTTQGGFQASSKPVIPNDFLHIFPTDPRLGSSAWIECFAFGKPEPRYNWTRVDKALSPHAVIKSFGRRLYFPQLQMNDTGTYRCTVENQYGVTTKEINLQLQISVSPRLVHPASDVVVELDGTAKFVCDVFGVPRLEYEWFHNAQPLDPLSMPVEDHGRITIDGNKLTIERVRERDAGIYQCHATNNVGQIDTSAELVVRNVKPTFAKENSDRIYYAVVGSSARLPCRAEALPMRRTTIWNHDNVAMTMGRDISTASNGDLIIDPVAISHNGRYTCTVENNLGVDSMSMMLTVLPQFMVSIRSTPSENRTTFECLIHPESNKHIDVARKWTFNCHDTDSLDQFRSLDSGSSANSPRISLRKDQYLDGVLMCRVDTVAGHASSSVEVEGKRLPMRPIRVTAHAVSINGIHTWWDVPRRMINNADDDPADVVYKVEASLSGGEIWKHVQTFHPRDIIARTGYLVTASLLPYCHYKFRVYAENRIGRSGYSTPSNDIRTRPGPPTKAVKNLRVTAMVSGEILVQWKTLQKSEWGSETVGYFVEWQFFNISSASISKSSVTLRKTDISHYVIRESDVRSCGKHEVRVSAFNEHGRGPIVSRMVEAYTLKIPYSQPYNVSVKITNSSTVSIHWKSMNGFGDQPCQKWVGFKIYYWTSEMKRGFNFNASKSFQSLKYASLNQSETMVTDLVSNTAYVFQMALFNAMGDGPRSPEVTVTTAKRGPKSAPLSVIINDDIIDGRTITVVRWTEVDSDIRISGYKVHLFRSPWTVPHVMKVDAKNSADWQPVIELDGLRSFREYKLSVSAYNEGGDGPLSEPVYFYFGSQSRSWSIWSNRDHALYVCGLAIAYSWKHLCGA